MKLLSFDLSSKTLGYAIFDLDLKELIELNYYSYPDWEKDLLNKGRLLENFIQNLLKKYSITHFVIEERLKKFQGGRSSADGILILAQLNYICQYLMKFKFCIQPDEINVLKARGIMFPTIFKVTRKTKQKQKEFVFDEVLKILGPTYFTTKIMKSGPRKGQTIYLEECKDMSDSYVLGMAWCKKTNYGNKQFSD